MAADINAIRFSLASPRFAVGGGQKPETRNTGKVSIEDPENSATFFLQNGFAAEAKR
jgi:hypothetical protein